MLPFRAEHPAERIATMGYDFRCNACRFGHDSHDHRRFPRERSGCVACPVCGSADIETRD